MSYLTDRLNAVFIETSLIRKQALDTAEAAGLHRGTALREASYAARKALREAERSAAQVKAWGAYLDVQNAERVLNAFPNPANSRALARAIAIYREADAAIAALRLEHYAASFVEGTPENEERMRQRNAQVARMKGRA